MATEFDPAWFENEYQMYFKGNWIEIESELHSHTLTKQEVITKAVERLVRDVDVTIAVIGQLWGEKSPDTLGEWRLPEMSFAEFLNELPRLLNCLAMDLYRVQASLNRAVFLRDVTDNRVDSSDTGEQHDGAS